MAIEFLGTIGGYGFTEARFFDTLVSNGVDCFCDVRARRGMRGSEYAFLNSKRLQARLVQLGIRYLHLKDLAPSSATRTAQREEDARLGESKRGRAELGQAFKDHYCQERLAGLAVDPLLTVRLQGVTRPVFFCVERLPAACHRSLLANAISSSSGIPVRHLAP